MTTSEAPPALAPEAEPVADPAGRERRIAAVLLVVTGLFALIAQTLLFHSSAAMGGDIAYHRGVGLTMSVGSFSGEGPIHGILSYYGGLYSLAFGWGSRLFGVPFDRLVSVVSWPFVLALPLALWWLGRGIWPGKALEPAVFVFLGTVASSLAFDIRTMWVNSLLLSGTNLWPMYPRDIALVLFVIALGLVMRDYARWRAPVAGLIAGMAICAHAQIGIYCVAVVVALLLWRAWPERKLLRWLVDAALVGGVAIGVSAWWWWPRVDEALETGRLVLKSYPGIGAPDASLAGYLVGLGAAGLLAFPGAWLALRGRRPVEQFAAAWFLVLTLFALAGPLLGDLGLITPRRAWFLAALPLVICAAIATTALIRRGPQMVIVGLLLAVIVIPSASEAWQTRDLVTRKWTPPQGNDLLSASQWAPAEAELRAKTIDRGSLVVVAPDYDALHIWEQTGAQPFSLWLPGWVKLGFDPAQVTPYSYLERVRMQSAAFAAGLPGVCKLSTQVGADAIVLRRDGDLLGTHDDNPAAQYRVGPMHRDAKSLDRYVAPGKRYIDRNATDMLVPYPPAELPLHWSDPDLRRVDVILRDTRADDPMQLRLGDGTVISPRLARVGSSVVVRFDTPNGVPKGSRLVATAAVVVSRIIGYQPVSDLPGPKQGPVVLDPDTLCRDLG